LFGTPEEDMPPVPVLSLSGIRKRFAGTQALDGVDFQIRPGEIHALLGENGAGKSTLIKIMAGIYTADAGEIRVNGDLVVPRRDRLPISFIHQDLGLVETMSVAENVALIAGYRHTGPFISWRKTVDLARRALASLGADSIHATVNVGDLPAAERSIVAIARALATECKIVVLDEPTAALPEPDVIRLLDALRTLAASGIAIIYVSHRLDEVFRVAHCVTVLRDGRVVGTAEIADTSPDQLVRMIVGRSLSEMFVEPPPPSNRLLLEVDDLEVGHVGPISLSVKQGEMVGLAGLRGAGHLLVGRAIYGAADRVGGTVKIAGDQPSILGPKDAIKAGLGLVPNRRREEGLANGLSVTENLYMNPAVCGVRVGQLINPRIERTSANQRLRQLSVRPAEPGIVVSALSGGNQQKVVLARWFAIGAKLLILEEPTLGVDVGAKADVYKLINEALASGHGVLLISSDFEEICGICHRALIFDRGRISAELDRKSLNTELLTALATGSVADPPRGERTLN
jgi:ribose transport system ATP-binding protein